MTFAVLVVKRSGLANVKSTPFSHKNKHFVFLTKQPNIGEGGKKRMRATRFLILRTRHYTVRNSDRKVRTPN